MRRWTLLLIPHDTEQPRSIAVSERAVRLAGSAAAFVVLAAVVGIGAVAALISRTGGVSSEVEAAASVAPAAAPSATAEVDSLRATVRLLTGTLDTIREADARLSAASGVPSADSATLRAHVEIAGTRAKADSLLMRASSVAGRMGALADSAGRGRPVKGQRGAPVASKQGLPR